MKTLLGVLSVSMWAAALLFSPAPAEAFAAWYNNRNVQYFSCSQYQTTYWECVYEYDGDGTPLSSNVFTGIMNQTIPLSSCGGACNGTQNIRVEFNPGNGRKTKTGEGQQCMGGYTIELQPCSNC